MRAHDKNILVISDLHLGEDLKPGAAGVSYLRHVARLERELIAFLRHYTTERVDGLPWRLVINGDMVDFMSILILPDAGEGGAAAAGGPDDEERRFGLGHGEAQSIAKMRRVFERHPGVFTQLAGFVAAGNELVIVVGNHDIEFCYPDVQRCFVDGLCALAPSTPAWDAADPEAPLRLRRAVRFCPWFYYEESVVYVEHGHQYDAYCSFDYQLHPVEPARGIALSIAHAGIRYFTNLVPSLDPHCGETWGFMHYMRWAAAHGVRGVARIFYLYCVLIWKLLEIRSTLTERRGDQERGARHRLALRALAAEYRVGAENLEALDQLHCVPVVRRLFKLLSAMFLDRALLGVALAVGLGLVLGLLPGWWKLGGSLGVLAAGASVNFALSRGRVLSSSVQLRRAPQAIWKIMRAPFIVFGHSHTTERVPLDGGGVYFNTGTWVATDDSSALPHLVIRPGDAPRAELWGWRDGSCAPLA